MGEMSRRRNSWKLLTGACGLLLACHGVCGQEPVPEGTTFILTVTSPSAECPEIVPLKAGDTLTLRAGEIWTEGGDGICTGNASTGAPPEFPQYPASAFKLGECSMGPAIGFDCTATAPDCAIGNIGGAGHVSAGLPLSRFPERGETTSTELIVNVTSRHVLFVCLHNQDPSNARAALA